MKLAFLILMSSVSSLAQVRIDRSSSLPSNVSHDQSERRPVKNSIERKKQRSRSESMGGAPNLGAGMGTGTGAGSTVGPEVHDNTPKQKDQEQFYQEE
jgi:hypothetical protein